MKNILILAIIAYSITSCHKKLSTNETLNAPKIESDGHNAQNSLDFEGIYKGSLPCADCEALETTIILNKDSYTKELVYKGKSAKVFKEEGKFTWNKAGNTIILSNSETLNQYFVGENVLIHLDINGKKIEGDLAPLYILKKGNSTENSPNMNSLKNTKWKLVKLNGKEVNQETKREIGISFDSENRFSAYAGCNGMGGDYEWNPEKLSLQFSKVIATMMVCEDMTMEKEFGIMLSKVDNYNLNETSLKLNKARMAPLAEFELSK